MLTLCLTGEAAWTLRHCRVPLLQCVRSTSLVLDTDSEVPCTGSLPPQRRRPP